MKTWLKGQSKSDSSLHLCWCSPLWHSLLQTWLRVLEILYHSYQFGDKIAIITFIFHCWIRICFLTFQKPRRSVKIGVSNDFYTHGKIITVTVITRSGSCMNFQSSASNNCTFKWKKTQWTLKELTEDFMKYKGVPYLVFQCHDLLTHLFSFSFQTEWL